VLKTVDGLGMSVGIAGLGAVFFSIVGGGSGRTFLTAGEWTALASAGLLAIAFVIAFWLPRRAREMGAPAAAPADESVAAQAIVAAVPEALAA
jgi:hypothetical protein